MESSFQGYINTRLEELSSRLKDYSRNNENEVFKVCADVRRTRDDIRNHIDSFPSSDWSKVIENSDLPKVIRSYLSTLVRGSVLELLNSRRIIIKTGDLSGAKQMESELELELELAKVLIAEQMKRKREEREEYLIRLYENQNILNDMVLKEVESMEERKWKKEEIDDYLIWLYENPDILIDMALEEVESMEKMNNRRTSAANQVNNSGKNSMMGMGGNGTTYICNRDSTIINHYHSITIK